MSFFLTPLSRFAPKKTNSWEDQVLGDNGEAKYRFKQYLLLKPMGKAAAH
jgi:hypothetical protein